VDDQTHNKLELIGDSMASKSNAKLFKILLESAQKVSMGAYDETDNLMELTRQDKYPAQITDFAEAFGMMIVKIEAREFNLEQLLKKIKEKNKKLEETLHRVQLLETIQKHMGKFIPKSVKDLISENPENPDLTKHDMDISVLFLDIAGYTKMSENISQNKMNYLIETYFSQFLDIIMKNNGDINETAGDGLMILFHGSDPEENAINAVTAAIDIQKKTLAINESLKDQYDPVMVNMGINSGIASVGSTRFQGIAEDRWTFTASGSVTNIAARVCSIATGGKIFITSIIASYIEDQFTLSLPEEKSLKNVTRSTLVHEVLTS